MQLQSRLLLKLEQLFFVYSQKRKSGDRSQCTHQKGEMLHSGRDLDALHERDKLWIHLWSYGLLAFIGTKHWRIQTCDFFGGGATHAGAKPRVPPNPVFSSDLRYLFFVTVPTRWIFWLVITGSPNLTKIYLFYQRLPFYQNCNCAIVQLCNCGELS